MRPIILLALTAIVAAGGVDAAAETPEFARPRDVSEAVFNMAYTAGSCQGRLTAEQEHYVSEFVRVLTDSGDEAALALNAIAADAYQKGVANPLAHADTCDQIFTDAVIDLDEQLRLSDPRR